MSVCAQIKLSSRASIYFSMVILQPKGTLKMLCPPASSTQSRALEPHLEENELFCRGNRTS